MKKVFRIGNRVKQTHEMGLEQISGMEIDAKVELIQADEECAGGTSGRREVMRSSGRMETTL